LAHGLGVPVVGAQPVGGSVDADDGGSVKQAVEHCHRYLDL
jgi:hypothetical protein